MCRSWSNYISSGSLFQQVELPLVSVTSRCPHIENTYYLHGATSQCPFTQLLLKNGGPPVCAAPQSGTFRRGFAAEWKSLSPRPFITGENIPLPLSLLSPLDLLPNWIERVSTAAVLLADRLPHCHRFLPNVLLSPCPPCLELWGSGGWVVSTVAIYTAHF